MDHTMSNYDALVSQAELDYRRERLTRLARRRRRWSRLRGGGGSAGGARAVLG